MWINQKYDSILPRYVASKLYVLDEEIRVTCARWSRRTFSVTTKEAVEEHIEELYAYTEARRSHMQLEEITLAVTEHRNLLQLLVTKAVN